MSRARSPWSQSALHLTTSFPDGSDRNTALGVWGALAGPASAVGVFLGGVLSEGPGWRCVLFVNLPVCALILVATFRLIAGERRRSPTANFDVVGATLVTAGMLLLVYALVRAPDLGWGKAQTILEFGGAAALLAAFGVKSGAPTIGWPRSRSSVSKDWRQPTSRR